MTKAGNENDRRSSFSGIKEIGLEKVKKEGDLFHPKKKKLIPGLSALARQGLSSHSNFIP